MKLFEKLCPRIETLIAGLQAEAVGNERSNSGKVGQDRGKCDVSRDEAKRRPKEDGQVNVLPTPQSAP